MKRNSIKFSLMAGASLLAAPGLAQEADVSSAEAQATAEGEPTNSLNEIIVTGRVGNTAQTQFEATVSVSTFDASDIAEVAPLTVADLFAQVPGVWAESSGGQAAANVFIRGIPAPGQFLFSKIQVDGLPVFEEHGIGFLTPDGLYRNDLTTERLEAVRGGSSSVFASNAPGGIFNYITKRGTDTPEGGVKFEWGDFGHYRVDANYAGPLGEDTTFSIGGFYRVADGVRDPGFRGDEGGQIRANLTQQFDRGELTVSASHIDDSNLFLLAIPLDLDEDGDLTDLTGIDANFGTLVSDDIRDTTLLFPTGPQEFDLSDGINNVATTIGLEFEYDLGGGFTVTNRSRYVDGETQFNSAIAFGAEDANTFLAGQLGAAQAAFGADVAAVTASFLDGTPFGLPDANGVGGNNGNGLIGTSGFFPVNSDYDNFINDLQLSNSFDTGIGIHNITAGFYSSFYSIEQFQTFAGYVHEIANSPRQIELTAVDADGNAVGTLSQNGFTNFSTGFFQNYSGDGEVFAWYLSDEWEVNDDLRIDGGIRYETQTLEGAVEIPGTFDLSAQNTLLPTGSLPTTADDAVVGGTGQFESFRETYDEFAWTIAGNYVWTDYLSTFARVSDGFRTPTLDDLASAGADNTGNVLVGSVFQVEGGFKVNLPRFQAFITGFYSEVDDQPFTEPVNDMNGDVIDATIIQSSETIGIEIETEIGPFYGFSINAKGTFQDPEFAGLTVSGGGLTVDDSAITGNRIPRIPSRIISVRPRFEFAGDDIGLGGSDGSIFLSIYNVGDRFSDIGNTILLPGYTTLGAGARLGFVSGFELSVVADNLTNTIGLTEGNPRTDLFAPIGGDVTTATFGRPIVGRNFRVSVGYSF
ncbi:TonB-dependent siderophore receptor [Erythrobacter rubeus]|uniref:TonB-dependent receptor n=1 Tax=Erythrobacter rubeus TaxID=2760803 RepID=A0ABR8KMW4_9SPHN|nr:TonB-dependent receptor [Erythrobacter rubeus]MBD2841900.1 TonB-dependent receptor [Erythrobacter rubeus]